MSTPATTTPAVPSYSAANLLRVERGHAEPEEVAALAAILLARAGAAAPAPVVGHGHSKAGWRRLERTPGFRAPHSWQG